MKCILLAFILGYCFHKTVFGARAIVRPKEIHELVVEPINYGADKTYLDEGAHKKISCKASHRFQRMEWHSPSGEVIKRDSSNRVYVQEHIAPSLKSKTQTLVLVFTHAAVEDSGVWECHYDSLVEKLPLCVLEPATFIETPDEVTVDGGRSITLSCQSRGDPEPKIQWYRNGRILSDGDRIYTGTKYNHHGYEGLLTIKSMTAEDSGEYSCEALQEVPDVDDCSYTNRINITLNVNFRPTFDSELETTYYFANTDESVNLICSPNAYPRPNFRWFREIGDMLTEYSDKQFENSDDGAYSNLTLVANSSTFEQKFKCTAKNEYGEASQTYQILELVKPTKVEISVANATDRMIEFNVTWNPNYGPFPVDVFYIQYLKKKIPGTPRDFAWTRAKTVRYELAQSIFEYDDILVPLEDLTENTEYWVRIRPFNSLGFGPWSTPTLASTEAAGFDESTQIPEELEEQEEPSIDYSMFYGFLFAALIVAFAAICMFFVKRL